MPGRRQSVVGTQVALEERTLVAKQLKRWRQYRKLAKREVQRLTGIPTTTILSLERPDLCNPVLSTLVRLAEAYGITVFHLLYMDPHELSFEDGAYHLFKSTTGNYTTVCGEWVCLTGPGNDQMKDYLQRQSPVTPHNHRLF